MNHSLFEKFHTLAMREGLLDVSETDPQVSAKNKREMKRELERKKAD